MSEDLPASPPAPPKRIELVDGLRGFALFGILVVNIAYFGTAFTPDLGLENTQATSWADDATLWLTTIFFETKFYLLFSLLFGYSFVLQMQSAERLGKRFKPRMARRLIGLFTIGSLHAVFLWEGDILMLYALLGALLIGFRNTRPRRAIKAAVIIIAVVGTCWILLGLLMSTDPAALEIDFDEERANALERTVAMRGSLGEILEYRISSLAEINALGSFILSPIVFALFLAGLSAAKTGALEHVDRFRSGFVRLLAFGLPIGLLGGVSLAWSVYEAGVESAWIIVGFGITILTGPLLMGSYVSIFALSASRQFGRRAIETFAPMGRMALSNYILQSVLMGFVFLGYGLGQFGRLGPFETLLVAIAIYALLLAFSHLWMRRFRYGPLEWLLRAFTNWERPPVGTIAP